MAKRIIVALAAVAFFQCLFVLCLVSASQLQVPRNMPFGATGASPVINAAGSKVSLQTTLYPSESAARGAVNQSEIYGAYIPGVSSDTLITVAQKSFFGLVEIVPVFEQAAKHIGRPLHVADVRPLPQSDRVGSVAGLLLLPTLLGGLLAAILLFKATGAAAQRWRATILVGYAVVGAFITDLVAGPLIGAYSNSHFWPLLPCCVLVTAAVALFSAGLQAVFKSVGTILVLILLIILGGASAGGGGPALLPTYWQDIGAWLPPRSAVELYRNTLYFGGNNITSALITLGVYALIGICLIFPGAWLRNRVSAPVPAGQASGPVPAGQASGPVPAGQASGRVRAGQASAPGRAGQASASVPAGQASTETASPSGPSNPANPSGPSNTVRILAALAIVAFMQFLFSLNYMSSGHEPIASNLPFGVTGPSSLLTTVKHSGYSLKVTQYRNEKAVKDAIKQAKLYGALIPGRTASTLLVVPTASDLAPLDLTVQFERAAKSQHQILHVQAYAPTPLPPKDPFGIVESLMLIPLLIGGYLSANLLGTATGAAAAHWRAAVLAGYALVAGMLINLIVALWLSGYPTDKFWIVWPILALIIYAVAMVGAVLGRLLGAAGTLVTVIIVILFGNPSSGGANGVPYLPGFWRDIGPYLPPRNAYILLHNTIYFSGHGTTQALVVLLVYAIILTAILGVLDWYHTPTLKSPVTPETDIEAAAMAVPVGAAP
jgi:hypothetical protein